MNLSFRGSDHTADKNAGANDGSIELFERAMASPDVDTARIIFRVSASCYRRLFGAVLVVLSADTNRVTYSQR